MNICVLSNSHAASLKSGWDSICSRYPNIDVTFFAAPNRGMARVNLDTDSGSYFTKNEAIGKVLRMTSGGHDRIELDEYDAFLVYGLFLETPRLDVRLSEAVKSAALDEVVSNSLNFRFVRELAENTQAAVFYSASPLPTYSGIDSDNSGSVYHSYRESAGWLESRYVHLRARFIDQSVDTLNSNGLTKKKYSIGSTRLMVGEKKSHLATDTRHMNNTYGAEFLERAIPAIRCHANNVIEI